ncbi:hypothetical protein E5D57_013796 [Metarhizium anisopliae]|nr:hypothetical protein E5D57_013796 [Metarhizium anisopliae]
MAEALGIAGSVIAVAELSAKVASLCLQYSKDVKHAKDDIDQVRRQANDLASASLAARQLLDGTNGANLRVSQSLQGAIQDGLSHLAGLHDTLSSKTARQVMHRLGVRSLKWPFQSADVEMIMHSLRRCKRTISFALQIDQTYVMTSSLQTKAYEP